jgi:glycosyltransferase involved in cell wall biosynthesis
MSGLKIGYLPFEIENEYVENMRVLLSRFGEVRPVPGVSPAGLFRRMAGRLERMDFVFINWEENLIINRRTGGVSPLGVCKFFLKILWWKAIARRQIFVRHNNYPHHAVGDARRYARLLIDFAESLFSAAMFHSGHLQQTARRQYVPHPLYRREYVADAAEKGVQDYYVVFGRLLPYKKIDELIAALPVGKRLLVFGSCDAPEYVAKLNDLARGKEVEIRPGYVDGLTAQEIIAHSRGVLIAHADDDMIVSGTYFFAATLGVPVFAVGTPFLEWARRSGKIDGLTTFGSVADLANNLPDHDLWNRALIRDQAVAHFGDREVLKALANLLGTSGKPR